MTRGGLADKEKEPLLWPNLPNNIQTGASVDPQDLTAAWRTVQAWSRLAVSIIVFATALIPMENLSQIPAHSFAIPLTLLILGCLYYVMGVWRFGRVRERLMYEGRFETANRLVLISSSTTLMALALTVAFMLQETLQDG